MFRKELLAEARFYQLLGMIACLTPPTVESVILTNEDHLSIVISWLPSGSTLSLLFRASSNGHYPETFHRYCNNKGPTVVVVRSNACVFDGFTTKPWTSREFILLFEVTNFINYT